jgi:hypothetical protein
MKNDVECLLLCPLAAGALDRVITAAIEGTTDQCGFRRYLIVVANAAAVNVIASGSQQP